MHTEAKEKLGQPVYPTKLKYSSRSSLDSDDSNDCLKWSVVFMNVFFLFWSLVIIGLGLWMTLDRSSEISEMLGQQLYRIITVFVFIIGAGCLLITTIGFCGTIRQSRCLIIVFFVILIFILLLIIASIFMAIIFRVQLEDAFKETMTKTLIERYGYDFNNRPENEAITKGWDLMQDRLNCCAIHDNGWDVYRETRWFNLQITEKRREFEREYVPASCCVTEWETRKPINLRACQNMGSAPPNVPTGPINFYLYYPGCYEKGKEFLENHLWALIICGIIVVIVLLIGAFLSFRLCKRWKN